MNKSGASSGVAARLLAKTRGHFEGILFNDRLSSGIITATDGLEVNRISARLYSVIPLVVPASAAPRHEIPADFRPRKNWSLDSCGRVKIAVSCSVGPYPEMWNPATLHRTLVGGGGHWATAFL